MTPSPDVRLFVVASKQLSGCEWTSLNDEELNVVGEDYSVLPNARRQRTETEGGVDRRAVIGHGPLIIEFADVMTNGGCSL